MMVALPKPLAAIPKLPPLAGSKASQRLEARRQQERDRQLRERVLAAQVPVEPGERTFYFVTRKSRLRRLELSDGQAEALEQGRLAACHAFGVSTQSSPELFPYGIYTIPEISTVGRNEEELTEQGIPYEVGKAQYREIARGQIIGDQTGLLKLIFHLDTHELLGVHIIGEGASELVHIGQAVMAFKGKVEFFINNVFNYPTLAECYKTAAFDGINRLGA